MPAFFFLFPALGLAGDGSDFTHAEPADQQARALCLVGPLQSRFGPEELPGVRPALSRGQAFVVQEGRTAYQHYCVADDRRVFGFRGRLYQPCHW